MYRTTVRKEIRPMPSPASYAERLTKSQTYHTPQVIPIVKSGGNKFIGLAGYVSHPYDRPASREVVSESLNAPRNMPISKEALEKSLKPSEKKNLAPKKL